jgi:hypothetical protein
MRDSSDPNVRINRQSSKSNGFVIDRKAHFAIGRKDIGRIEKHIGYDEEYQRLIALLAAVEYYDPPSTIIKRWNDAVFGEIATALWNKRLGLY